MSGPVVAAVDRDVSEIGASRRLGLTICRSLLITRLISLAHNVVRKFLLLGAENI